MPILSREREFLIGMVPHRLSAQGVKWMVKGAMFVRLARGATERGKA
jgi:hypothetical protein